MAKKFNFYTIKNLRIFCEYFVQIIMSIGSIDLPVAVVIPQEKLSGYKLQ